MEVYYFGDIDSEGFGIYKVKRKVSKCIYQATKQAYVHLISLCNRNYPWKGKVKNQVYLDFSKGNGRFLGFRFKDKPLIYGRRILGYLRS